RDWVAERAEDADQAALIERAVVTLYREHPPDSVPREILVPVLPENVEALQSWLGEIRGAKVSMRVARRGGKRTLMRTVEENASQSRAPPKVRRASGLSARSQA